MDNKICECEKPVEVLKAGVYICENCFVILDDIEFENNLFGYESKNNIRQNKFERHLYSMDIPWFVRLTFSDIFKTIENFFYDSERINFINMHQLCIELCRYTGYEEYIKCFTPLKTKARVLQVQKFVRSALATDIHGIIPLIKMEDLPLIKLNSPDYNDPRIVRDDHIYSDYNINEKTFKTFKTKAKAKAKTPKTVVRLRLKDQKM